MLISEPQKDPHDENIDSVAVIATALERKFGQDALQIAKVQAACAGIESVASWLAVVDRLRG